jgi:outer membrane lipoprotein-sorting protein
MKSFLIPLVTVSLLAASMTPLNAASAEELLRAHANSIGGVEAHKELTTRVLKGELRMPEQGVTAQFVIRAKAPDKVRTELEIPGLGKLVEAYDGEVAWSENPFVGLMEKPAEQHAQARRQADFYRDVELFSRHESWTVQGKDTVGGRPVHVLEGKSEGGSSEILSLDVAKHWIIQAKTRDGDVETTIRLDDYRDVDGVKIPFQIELDAGSAGTFLLRVKEVQHGVALDDELFTMPSQ